MSKISVREAQDGDEIKPGHALLAPGGQQMEIKKSGQKFYVHISPAVAGQNYKPCIDITFSSLSEMQIGRALAIILTGMGSDGCAGVLKLKSKGSQVWVQNEESSVVYGMPASVVEAGGADYIYSIDEIATYLAQKV
jgi:two-component system chemotaxis response regulator CheB